MSNTSNEEKSITVKLTPQFAIEIALALKNMAGVELTGAKINKIGRTQKKGENYSHHADEFMDNITTFIEKEKYELNEEEAQLLVEFLGCSATVEHLLRVKELYL